MSLTEITRNCFQSGIPAQKWLSLCKQFVAENPIIGNPELVASGISNSVLFIYRSYPADPSLNKYLVYSLKDGMLPLPVYVSTFLAAARSAELHSAATLDFLCDLALKTHEESGHLPLGSLVSPTATPISNLDSVQDALALVRVSHTMTLNHHHDKLVQNSERLLYHLLSCVTDVSEVTVTQAFLSYSTISDILREVQLDVQVRGVLENFAISLGMLIGDDAKVAREAQMMQSLQIAKTNVGGLNSETDVISLGLLWQYMVIHRAHEFGAGNTQAIVTLLVSTWRWTSWSAQVFYMQLFLSAFACLASCPNAGDPLLWRAFIVGRIPSSLLAFHKVVSADQSLTIDWRSALRQGLKISIRRQDLIVSGDHIVSQATGSTGNGGVDGQTSYTRNLVLALVKAELIDHSFALEVDPLLAIGGALSFQMDSQDTSMEVTAEFEARLAQDMDAAEATQWADRISKDISNHANFAALVLKRFEASSRGLDVEPLSRLCQLLYTNQPILDLVALHIKISDLVFYALSFLEHYDCETVGDPQTAVSHLGDVVLFLQYIFIRFQFEQETFVKGSLTMSTSFLRDTDEVLSVDSAQNAETTAFHSWFKALFDSSSEGIEDSILRSTHPKLLLRISATLFVQAIKAIIAHQIDMEILLNGVSYFTGPLLNWTLVGVVKALINEIQVVKNPPAVTFDILQTLITSPSCPQPVRALCSPQVLRYIAEQRNNNAANRPSFDIATVEDLIRNASNRVGNADINSRPIYWSYYPRNQIRAAMSMARNSKIIDLDVDRCLKILHPTKFLQVLWSELSSAAAHGEFELCRRVATFILAMPRNSQVPPLLPIFMHLFLPSLLRAMDKQVAGQDPTSGIELTSSIILSTLTAAFHLEWSMTTILNDSRTILGASSSAMAKRLSNELRIRRNGPASQAVLQRLASSPAFVANFPYFAPEIGN